MQFSWLLKAKNDCETYLRYYWCYEYVRMFMNWSPDILDLLEG